MKKILFAGNVNNSVLPQDVFSVMAVYPQCIKQEICAIEKMGAGRPICVVEQDQMEQWGSLFSQFGFRYGKDYIDVFAAVRRYGTSHRKLAIFYGNCQMHDYFDCLNTSEEFRRQYDSVYFKYQEYPRWREDYLEGLLDICDLLVITNESFDEKFRNCDKYIKRHNANAKVIHITTYSFRGYFPQTNPHIQAKGEYDIVNEYFNTFHREDVFVNALIKDGLSCDEIVRKVMSGDCFKKEEIKSLFEISLKQLEVMDRKSDIKIADFVRKNCKENRLFKDPVHMENILVWYVSNRLLELVGIEPDENIPEKEIHYFTELPIYPEVAKEMNLKWITPDTCYRVRMKEGMIALDIVQFYERYYQLAGSADEIKKSLEIQRGTDRIEEWFF